jgi:polyisoprenoid-binding protein YceI
MRATRTQTSESQRRRLVGLVALAALQAAVTAKAAETDRFKVDASRSHLRLELERTGLMKFMGHVHHIEVPIAEGQLEVPEGDPARSSLRLRMESAKIHVIPGSEPVNDIPAVEERMRGPEVLEVGKFPEVVFASTSVKKQSESGSVFRLVVSGTLTLKGRSFPVEIPLEAQRADGGIDAKGELFLNLRDIGVEPPSVAGVVKVANRFRLEFEIHARP